MILLLLLSSARSYNYRGYRLLTVPGNGVTKVNITATDYFFRVDTGTNSLNFVVVEGNKTSSEYSAEFNKFYQAQGDEIQFKSTITEPIKIRELYLEDYSCSRDTIAIEANNYMSFETKFKEIVPKEKFCAILFKSDTAFRVTTVCNAEYPSHCVLLTNQDLQNQNHGEVCAENQSCIQTFIDGGIISSVGEGSIVSTVNTIKSHDYSDECNLYPVPLYNISGKYISDRPLNYNCQIPHESMIIAVVLVIILVLIIIVVGIIVYFSCHSNRDVYISDDSEREKAKRRRNRNNSTYVKASNYTGDGATGMPLIQQIV